jgi:glycosyltransferase involved in cell wall biosynthesis
MKNKMIMTLKDKLTVVIPCKNEKNVILKTLDLLNYQTNIEGLDVIVCDNSDDGFTKRELLIRSETKIDKFNLIVTSGGLPSIARNKGFDLSKTPYVLFIDSDIFILDGNLINKAVEKIISKDLDLLTVKFRSENGKFNYVYKTFDVLQFISKYITPFSLGGFMLVKSETFKKIGGFDEEIKVAEDYQFSKQIKSKKFDVLNNFVFTPPRRFENKGLWYMIKLFVGSFLNNNKKYFKEDKDYWS